MRHDTTNKEQVRNEYLQEMKPTNFSIGNDHTSIFTGATIYK
ncbi:hypothetical protein ACTHGU_07865 [Chitinophagaceae bacterium MMS25-I14]